MINKGNVMINQNIVTQKRFAVTPGMAIEISIPEFEESAEISAEPFEFEILFETDFAWKRQRE